MPTIAILLLIAAVLFFVLGLIGGREELLKKHAAVLLDDYNSFGRAADTPQVLAILTRSRALELRATIYEQLFLVALFGMVATFIAAVVEIASR